MRLRSIISVLGTIWDNKILILSGIYRRIFKNDFVEVVAKSRKDICKSCSSYGGKCLVPYSGKCCGECGCVIEYKIRSLGSECPLGKWGVVKDEEIEL